MISTPAESGGVRKPEEIRTRLPALCPEWKERVIMEERLYDLVFIVRPATPEEETRRCSRSSRYLRGKGGKIEKTENWGTRKLAYAWRNTAKDLHSPGDSYYARRTDCGARAASPRARQRDQVSDRTPGRRLEATEELTLKREKRAHASARTAVLRAARHRRRTGSATS